MEPPLQHVFLLVIALAGSDWNCTETDGLWDCRPARSVPKAPAPPLAPVSPASAIAAGAVAFPEASGAATIAAPASAPVQAPAAVAAEAPAAVPDEKPEAVPAQAPANGQQLAGIDSSVSGSEQPIPGLKSSNAFVVQVGAYRQRVDAEQEVSRLDYESLAIVSTERDGEVWWVIVLGAFDSLESARSAGAQYEAATGGSFWVRTSDDLQAVLAAPR